MKKFWKWICVACTIVSVLTLLSLGVAADTTWNTWENVEWYFDEDTGTLTLGGEGAVPTRYDLSNYPWGSYANQVKSVVVEEGITKLGRYCIYGSTMGYTELHFPSTLQEIEWSDFMLPSSNLTTITVAEGSPYYAVDNVLYQKDGDDVALICYPGGLTQTTYTIPEGVTSIEQYALKNTHLQKITLPESLVTIDACAFDGMSGVKTITIPKNVSSIHEDAFTYCLVETFVVDADNEYFTTVDGVLFSKDMKILHSYPVSHSRTEYTVPDGVEQIPSSLYRWAPKLEKLYLSDTVQTIQYVLAGSSGSSVTGIYVDDTNPYLTDIDGILYDKDVKTLLAYPCAHPSHTYTMPDTVETIGEKVAYYISALQTIHVSSSLQTVTDNWNYWGVGVTGIYFPGDVPTWLNQFCRTVKNNATLYYPAGNTTWTDGTMTVDGNTYTTATYDLEEEITWNTWDNIKWYFDEDTGTMTIAGEGAIPSVAYSGYPWSSVRSNIKTLVFAEGITTVPGMAFSGTYSLTTLSIPASMKSIASGNPSLFANANNLSNITAAEGGTYFVQDGVLYTADTLVFYPIAKTDTTYTIPEGIKTIGTYAFPRSATLTVLTLPESLETIEESALTLHNVQSLYIPKNVSNIHKYAFSLTYTLTAYTVDSENSNYTDVDGVLYTKDMTQLVAYPDNHPATTFTVPDTVVEMTSSMLHTSRNLKILNLPASVTTIWSNRSSSNVVVLEEINVDVNNSSYCAVDGVLYNKDMTTLHYYPANKADTEFHIPDSVTTVPYGSMTDLQNLKTLYFGSGVTSVGSSQFTSPQLTSIYFPGDLPSWFHSAFSHLRYYNMLDTLTFYYPTGASGWTSPTMELSGVTYKTAVYERIVEDDTWDTWNTIKWKYDEETKTLTIKGEGEIPTSTSSDPYPWSEYSDSAEHIVFEEGITVIPNRFWNNYSVVQTLALPSTLTQLGSSSNFWNMYKLETISVTAGGIYYTEDGVLFKNVDNYRTLVLYPPCKSDTEYIVPNTVQSIGEYAFYSTGDLKFITISASVEEIHRNAVAFCDFIESISVDADNPNYASKDGVLYSKDMTVLHLYPINKQAESFTVPDTVKEMTSTMFTVSKKLKKLEIPASVDTIREVNLIAACCVIEEINVAEDNPNYCSVDGVLYSKDMTTLYQYPNNKAGTEYTIPDTVNSIQWSGLWLTKNLTTLYMGNGLKNLGRAILGYDTNITSVYFPGDLPDYFAKAFADSADQITFYYLEGASGWTSPTMELSGVTYKTASYTQSIAGDINGDGKVTMVDYVILQNYFSGKTTVDFDPTKADFNGDGKFTRADVMYLARALANWDGYSIE